MSYVVYVLRSATNGRIYIGQTSNLAKRLAQHNDPQNRLSLYTKRNPGPWVVVYTEEYVTRTEAVRRERELKSGQGRSWLHSKIILSPE